jgi:hypothetical protein
MTLGWLKLLQAHVEHCPTSETRWVGATDILKAATCKAASLGVSAVADRHCDVGLCRAVYSTP